MSEFTYCLNTSTIQPAGLMEKIRIAGEAGYRAIELWNSDLAAYSDGGGKLRDVAAALQDAGLTVPSVIHIGGWLDAEGDAYGRALDEAERKMEQARAVGAPRIVAGPPPGPVDLARAGERYRELLDLGRRHGVLPAMEFLGFVRGVHTIRSAWEIVTRANDPDGAIVLDPFHIFRGGSDYAEMDLIPAGRVAICHFNDAPGTKPREEQGDADRVFPGDGILPLKDLVGRLRRKGYRGALSLELFNRGYWERDPLAAAKEGLAKMRAVVEG